MCKYPDVRVDLLSLQILTTEVIKEIYELAEMVFQILLFEAKKRRDKKESAFVMIRNGS